MSYNIFSYLIINKSNYQAIKQSGFFSIWHSPHPKVKNIKKVHRLVILPDYQGIGIGGILLNSIADIYKKDISKDIN